MNLGKINIRPTQHYILEHSDVEWDLVIRTILSPTNSHINARRGKDRYTYIKVFKKWVVEVHTKNDEIEGIVWVINAFKSRREK